MSESIQDVWLRRLIRQEQFGADSERIKLLATNSWYPVRDALLRYARLREGDILLDVGCGDGLIGFGALEKTETCHVIFSDIDPQSLNNAQETARESQCLDRCEFLRMPAENLSPLADEAVDVVAMRIVLGFVSAKQQAFNEIFRVLKPKGRLALVEPISRFGWPEPPHRLVGYDITPVMALADKIKAICFELLPPDSGPMFDFDERTLLDLIEQAGFREIHLELRVNVSAALPILWEVFTCAPLFQDGKGAPAPTLEAAMTQTLTAAEAEQLVAHLRPLVETGQGLSRSAVAYLWAIKQ